MGLGENSLSTLQALTRSSSREDRIRVPDILSSSISVEETPPSQKRGEKGHLAGPS